MMWKAVRDNAPFSVLSAAPKKMAKIVLQRQRRRLGTRMETCYMAFSKIVVFIGLLAVLLCSCGTKQAWYRHSRPEMVWFQKGVADEKTQSDLETCRHESPGEKTLRRCMQSKGYLLVPRAQAELLKVKSLQNRGVEDKDIAMQLGLEQKKVAQYTAEDYEMGHINALGKQPVDVLASLGRPAVPQLIHELKSQDPLVRRHAAEALGEIRDTRAIDPLGRVLKDKDALIRRHAVKALGKIGDPRAVPLLAEILNDPDEQSHVRMTAAEALGDIGDKRAVEPLVSVLTGSHWTIRRSAAIALGAIRDPRAVAPLITALQDEDASVRGRVVETLGTIKDPRAVGPLHSALKDPDGNVRKLAEQALTKIAGTAPR
jgi:hypothetical protein